MQYIFIGFVSIPSGRVVIGDPLGNLEQGWQTEVPPGGYRVQSFVQGGSTPMAAVLELAETQGPISWQQVSHMDTSSGLCCFVDADALPLVDHALIRTQLETDDGRWIDYSRAWNWRMLLGGTYNMFLVQGKPEQTTYTCYAGYNKHGVLVQLLVNFGVLPFEKWWLS